MYNSTDIADIEENLGRASRQSLCNIALRSGSIRLTRQSRSPDRAQTRVTVPFESKAESKSFRRQRTVERIQEQQGGLLAFVLCFL